MTVVDLHPEDLLDKKARGALTASEGERLEAHLARCATCRVEMQLRADFAAELDDDARALDEDRPSLTALLEGVAASGDRSPRTKTPRDATPPGVDLPTAITPPPAGERTPRRVRRASTAPAWFLVAAAMLAVSAATGATGVGKRVWTRVVSVVTTIDTVPASAPASAPAKHVAHATQTGAPQAPAPVVPAIEPASIAAPPPVIEAPAAPVIAPAPVAVPRAAPRARGHATTTPSPDAEAARLFDDASAARRQGDYGRAIALNRELASRFPRTREAQTSRATVGRLLLDRGDPSGALASFDAYMAAGSGELGEEAMAGRATALERLGRADEARRAWEGLLAAYPGTPYASHARARLAGASENAGR